MKSSGLERLMAEVLDLEYATVRLTLRHLKAAGLISTGPRGPGAPEMTALDVARAVLAVLVTDRPVRAVEAVRDFGALMMAPAHYEWKRGETSLEALTGISGTFTAEEALAALFTLYSREWKPASGRERPRRADLAVSPTSLAVWISLNREESYHFGADLHGAYIRSAEFTGFALTEIGKRWHRGIEVLNSINEMQIGPLSTALRETPQ
jgi:hypothetical protein